jgi:hypothetical protein
VFVFQLFFKIHSNCEKFLKEAVGEFVRGFTPQRQGEAFAFKFLATNLHLPANADATLIVRYRLAIVPMLLSMF